MSIEEVKAAETLGLIQGLADVVKNQQSTFQTQQATYLEALQETNQQLSSLSGTSEILSKSIQKSTLSAGSGLCLPNVTLPEFTGKQNLDRFMAQMESLLLSSSVSIRFWLTYPDSPPAIIDPLCFKIATAVSATRRETNVFEASHFLNIFQLENCNTQIVLLYTIIQFLLRQTTCTYCLKNKGS